VNLDCIVIGAGHNGLVCATSLARAGRKVLVLEARDRVGGAAVTREFAPGFRVSAGAHLLYLMPDRLIRELELERHGLQFAARALPSTALDPAGALTVGPEPALAPRSRDAATWREFSARMQKFSRLLLAVLAQTPARLGSESRSDRRALLSLALRIRLLGRRDMRELLRIGAMNVYDLLEEYFETPLLKGALGFDAVLGSNFGPRSPGTVLTWLYRLAGQSGSSSGLAVPRGGLGAVSDALANAARAAGATLRTGAAVARILVRDDRAAGVVLESGEEIAAGLVVSNADPKATFLTLLGPEHLDAGFVRRIDHLRARGNTAKVHLALDGLPEFPGLEAAARGNRLLISPSLDYLEHAYNHTKYGEASPEPALEISLPTVHDPSLAPPGQHVLSAIVQFAPYALKSGWPQSRAKYLSDVIALIERYSPGLAARIVSAELVAPPDVEREFGITGGHWHHAELALDQFYFVRPVPGAAQYQAPISRLYLCGAGCHPGGGIMGLAGRNAARQILKAA
jgi:phytoene dehydrogenase-like protein